MDVQQTFELSGKCEVSAEGSVPISGFHANFLKFLDRELASFDFGPSVAFEGTVSFGIDSTY